MNSYVFTFMTLMLGMFSSELIFRAINGFSLFNIAVFRIFCEMNMLASILTFILLKLKTKVRIFISLLIVFASNAYAFLQLGFNNFLGVYISFQVSSQLGAVKDYIMDFILSFNLYYFLTLLPFIFLLVMSIKLTKHLQDGVSRRNRRVATFSILAISSSLFIASIIMPMMQSKDQTITTRELFRTVSNPSLTVEQYGSLGFCILDIKAMVFPVSSSENYELFSKPKDNETSLSPNSRIIDDQDWEKIINNEKNTTLNNLNKYFINRDITDKNEYTGLFEGKNLIVIMMESVIDIFINEEGTNSVC